MLADMRSIFRVLLAMAVVGCSSEEATPPSDPPKAAADHVGVVNILNGYSHLVLDADASATTFHLADGGEGALLPCAGDFDGDGWDSVAVFDIAEAVFVLQHENRDGAPTETFAFGEPSDLPVCGDFDGDGIDTIGVYDAATGELQLRNQNAAGSPDVTFTLGVAGGLPIAGDFDGDGVDTLGVFEQKTGVFHLDGAGSDKPRTFSFGAPGGWPLAGDFDGDGIDTVAVFDGKTGALELRNENTAGPADELIDLPVLDFDVAGAPPIHTAIAGQWRDSGARAELGGFDWPTSTPASEGIDVAALDAAIDKARALPRLHSLLVVRHGKLVTEEYFHGAHRGMANNVQSVSKSVLSLLYGIALKKGLYKSGTPAQQAMPALGDDPARQGILIEHLLTMSAGLSWSEIYPLTAWTSAPDPLRYVWDQPVAGPPGEQFLYSTGLSYVAGAVLQELVGERIDGFARRELFAPAGIELHYWNRLGGVPHGGSAMHILPRDMARIGELVLHEGTLDGTEVVSSEWIQGSTAPLLSTNDPGAPYEFYGAKWWVIDVQGELIISARGLGGQFIFIVPALDAVVVTTSVWYTTDESYNDALSLILLDVLPAITP
jgi:CubicO group peptidase (beta-lactamase class C family)